MPKDWLGYANQKLEEAKKFYQANRSRIGSLERPKRRPIPSLRANEFIPNYGPSPKPLKGK